MKVTYWVCKCWDSEAYTIRTRTKKEAMEIRQAAGNQHALPIKVTLEYRDAFDLLNECLGEDRACMLLISKTSADDPQHMHRWTT